MASAALLFQARKLQTVPLPLLGKGKASALVLARARIPLQADPAEGGPGWIDEHIAEARDASAATVELSSPQPSSAAVPATLPTATIGCS